VTNSTKGDSCNTSALRNQIKLEKNPLGRRSIKRTKNLFGWHDQQGHLESPHAQRNHTVSERENGQNETWPRQEILQRGGKTIRSPPGNMVARGEEKLNSQKLLNVESEKVEKTPMQHRDSVSQKKSFKGENTEKTFGRKRGSPNISPAQP